MSQHLSAIIYNNDQKKETIALFQAYTNEGTSPGSLSKAVVSTIMVSLAFSQHCVSSKWSFPRRHSSTQPPPQPPIPPPPSWTNTRLYTWEVNRWLLRQCRGALLIFQPRPTNQWGAVETANRPSARHRGIALVVAGSSGPVLFVMSAVCQCVCQCVIQLSCVVGRERQPKRTMDEIRLAPTGPPKSFY